MDYFTDKEANSKWCPHGDDAAHCAGSKCMLWVTKDFPVAIKTITEEGVFCTIVDPPDDPVGRCGLVR